MKLGKVFFKIEYVIDLENSEMYEDAKEAIYEDIQEAIKNNELNSYIDFKEDSNLNEKDIHSFLIENDESRKYYQKD